MNKLILSLVTLGVAALLGSAIAQDNPAPEPAAAPPEDQAQPPPGGDMAAAPAISTDAAAAAVLQALVEANSAANPGAERPSGPTVILPGASRPGARNDIQSAYMPPTTAGTNDPNDISLDFRNAPLEMVLNYLSDASDFVIILDTRVNGNVTIKGNHMTRKMVTDLLNNVLNKNGYAVIRDDRMLTVVDKNDARMRDIPVKSGNVPDQVPKNAEIVTQIIPIRFVEARQLMSDLTSFVSPQATVVANEIANSIIITDTQSNIRHLMEVIRAIDNSAQSETEIRVFPLKYANPTDVASELSSIFPSSGSGGSSPTRFNGGGGGGRNAGGGRGGGGMMGGMNPFAALMGGGGNSSNDRISKATAVNAVADPRIQAVIVTAPKDMMDDIDRMMKELDVPSDRDQKVYVFTTKNADPQAAALVLQNMFSSGTTGRSGNSSQTTSLLDKRAQNAATTTTTTTTGFGTTSSTGGGGRSN